MKCLELTPVQGQLQPDHTAPLKSVGLYYMQHHFAVVVMVVVAAAVEMVVAAIMVLVEVGVEADEQDYGGHKPDPDGIELCSQQFHLCHHSRVLVFPVPD